MRLGYGFRLVPPIRNNDERRRTKTLASRQKAQRMHDGLVTKPRTNANLCVIDRTGQGQRVRGRSALHSREQLVRAPFWER
jgi:hypothetical protein